MANHTHKDVEDPNCSETILSMGAPYHILFSEDDDIAPSQTISDCKAAVIKLIGKAAGIYSQRIQQFEGEKMGLEGTQDKISEPLSDLRKAVVGLNQSYQSLSLGLNDHFFIPFSVEYHEDRDVGSIKERIISLSSPPSIHAHGVHSQVLFDVCVPKNIDNWEIRSPSSLGGRPFSSARKHLHFNPFKCIIRL
ncbi:hypothetical protein LguiA_006664 [Lonicera macranthoides]